MRITEEEYREAYLLWKKENREAKNVPQSTIVVLPNQKEILLGKKIHKMKGIYRAMQQGEHYGMNKDLTEEQIDWWTEHGVDLGQTQKINYTEEEYREAYLLWKKENKEATSVSTNLVVELSNGKKIPLGSRISRMRKIYGAMQQKEHFKRYADLTEEQIAWWKNHGVVLGQTQKINYTEEEYREAYLIWKKENREAKYVPQFTVVILPNQKKILLGRRIHKMKGIYQAMQQGKRYGNCKDLTSEQIAWWTEHGVDFEQKQRIHYTEEEYREAYLLWKNNNKEKVNVPRSAVVIILNGKQVPLGYRISLMKSVYQAMQQGERYENCKDLTSEQIAWWTEHGVDFEQKQRIHYTEEEYREAYLLWKNNNKEKANVPYSVVVIISNGKQVSLGHRISLMKSVYQAMQQGKQYGNNNNLTNEQIAWWAEHGLNWEKYCRVTQELPKEVSVSKTITGKSQDKKDKYQEAYLFWKKENPEATSVPTSLIVELPDRRKVSLGNKISRMKHIYVAMQRGEHYKKQKDLTKEEILWWKNQGIDLSISDKQDEKEKIIYTEEEYREAYLLWKEKNKGKSSPLAKEIITLPNGKDVSIGLKISKMKAIYKAMQEGKHYGKNRDLTIEQIDWWSKNGLDFNAPKRLYTEEEYRKAYLLWKKENSEAKHVPQSTIVILPNQKEIPLGKRINTMKSIYRAMQQGQHYGKCKDLTKEQIEWWTEHGFDFEIKKSDKESLKKHSKKKKKNQSIKTIRDLLLVFHMNTSEFIRSLESVKTKQKQKTSGKSFEGIEEKTLHRFCFKEGYQYPVVSKAIKLHSFLKKETLEQLIHRVLLEKENKQEISSWVFEFYGSMIKEVLEKLNLNVEQVLQDISKRAIPIEEAICHSIFQTTCKQGGCDYLEDIYQKVIEKIDFQSNEEETAEKIVEKIITIGKRNHLMSDEIDILKNSLIRCLEVIREYQVIEVGLELDENKKLEKIRNYNLTEEEIEESYFVPFYFEEGILLGEKSELYRRRELLRQYIIDWDYYTEEEKKSAKKEQHFTEEELLLMETTRREIDETIKESQKIKKYVGGKR